jgi:hypothetical protein
MVVDEYWRAKAKHGEMTMDGVMLGKATANTVLRLACLMEEVGEVARALTYDNEKETDEAAAAHLIEELVQVANVAVTWASYLQAGMEGPCPCPSHRSLSAPCICDCDHNDRGGK